MTPSGIEPATFRFVAQRFNQIGRGGWQNKYNDNRVKMWRGLNWLAIGFSGCQLRGN